MRDDDELRDAHLLAALRHAPDHDVAPPRRLSEAILAQAREAVPAAGTAWRVRLQALNQWLSPPALAGAVATLALATGIGVMWRSGAPEPEPAVTIAQAPAAPAMPEPVPARELAAAPATAAPPPPNSPPAAKARAPAARREPTLAAPPPPPHAAPAAPADLSLADAAAPRLVLAPDPLVDVAVALRDQPDALRVLSAARAESFAAADLARQRSAAAPRSDTMTSAQWLARVTQATQGRWQAQAAPLPEADGESRSVLLHGVLAGRLQFTGAALWWLPAAAPGQAWRADLDAAVLQDLLANAPRR